MPNNLNEREIEHLYKWMERMEQKMDDLREWRWKVVGAAAGVSAIVSVVIAMWGGK